MGLFKPIWMKKEIPLGQWEKARRLACSLEGGKLIKAAVEAPNLRIRKIAVDKLTDQTVLLKIAMNDPDLGKRAYDRLIGEIDHTGYALRAASADVRRAAVERTDDQTVLARAARRDKSEYVRTAAVEKLTDQEVLREIALTEREWKIRETAVGRLTVPALDMDVYREIKALNPGDEFLAGMLQKMALAGKRDAAEELCGWLSDPSSARIAAETLREVYAVTREDSILRHCGMYGKPHNDWVETVCDHYDHRDNGGQFHFDLQ